MQTAQSSGPAPGAAGGTEGATPQGAQGPYSQGGEGSGAGDAVGSAQDALGGATSALPPIGGDAKFQAFIQTFEATALAGDMSDGRIAAICLRNRRAFA